MKIGFIHLPLSKNLIHYPLSWCIIKTTIETKSKNTFDFLEPVIRKNELTEQYLLDSEILMISLYAWNRNETLNYIQKYKEINPAGVIVAGGPHMLPDDHQLFDYVVTHEAETCIHLIVDKICGDNIDRIPCTRSNNLTEYFLERCTDFSVSPYLYQREAMENLNVKFKNLKLSAILETNRGCPYGCTFCDWGQATLSKIRQRPLDIVEEEIKFLAELEPNYVYLADANFGILPRDVDIAKTIADVKNETGHPKNMYVSYSKNNLDRNYEIAKILFQSGSIQNYTFSLQHTDTEILKNIDRQNASYIKLKKLSENLLETKIPTFTQLIIGNPGDTLEKWKRCLYDVLELNLHEEIRIYYFCVLPGAPAAAPEYINKFKLKFSSVNYFNQSSTEKSADQTSDIVVESNSFTKKDWIEMNIFGRLIQACHDLGLVKVIAIYLHNNNIKSYDDFYNDLFNLLNLKFNDLFNSLRTALENWITTTESILDWNPDEVLGLEIEEKLCFHFLKNKDKFYQVVLNSLGTTTSIVEDLVAWQKNVIIDIDYIPIKGRPISSMYDWDEWLNTRNWNSAVEARTLKSRYADSKVGAGNWDLQEIVYHNSLGKKRYKMFAYQMFTGVFQRNNRLYLKNIIKDINV
jgi:putative methyltransferase